MLCVLIFRKASVSVRKTEIQISDALDLLPLRLFGTKGWRFALQSVRIAPRAMMSGIWLARIALSKSLSTLLSKCANKGTRRESMQRLVAARLSVLPALMILTRRRQRRILFLRRFRRPPRRTRDLYSTMWPKRNGCALILTIFALRLH